MITADKPLSNVVITATNGTYTYKTTMNGTTATIVINRPGTYTIYNTGNYTLSTSTASITSYSQVIHITLSSRIYILQGGNINNAYMSKVFTNVGGEATLTNDGIRVTYYGSGWASSYSIYIGTWFTLTGNCRIGVQYSMNAMNSTDGLTFSVETSSKTIDYYLPFSTTCGYSGYIDSTISRFYFKTTNGRYMNNGEYYLIRAIWLEYD